MLMATNTFNVSLTKQGQGKVPSACQRCKKQKLKCDVDRPCTLCSRAGVDCISNESTKWKTHEFKSAREKKPEASTANKRPRTRKRLRAVDDGEADWAGVDDSIVVGTPEQSPAATSATSANTPWNSSSTITLVEEAFHQYNVDLPEESETSALAARQWRRAAVGDTEESRLRSDTLQDFISRSRKAAANRKSKRARVAELAAADLASLLPSFKTVALLVDNYFERIHWFTMVFHQDAFRQKFHELYPGSARSPSTDGANLGHLSVLVAVCAVSLEHLSLEKRETLVQNGTEIDSLQDQLLSTLRVRLLDMLSWGSLETVQACILLGTYYLNQGEPELAWPLCGCGLRIAQTLNLHRKLLVPESASPEQLTRFRQAAEARKRCWWAIYEFETLCSIIYGFPLSISDEDCDVEPLDAHDKYSGASRNVLASDPTLLSYKCAMSQISLLVRTIVKELYGSRRLSQCQGNPNNNATTIRAVVQKVASLDSKVLSWYDALPTRLKLGHLSDKPLANSPEISEGLQKGSAEEFEDQLFQLHALTLKLAYENARILIHRPLLSFRMAKNATKPNQTDSLNPFRSSIQACRSAALQVSRLGSVPIFNTASDTYAAAFVSLHLLTAGIALCIMTNLDSLSVDSHESKIGVHRLMTMQNQLKTKSIVAEQGLDILGQLMSLVMKREMDKMFEFGTKARDDETGAKNPKPPSAAAADVPGSNEAGSNNTARVDAAEIENALGEATLADTGLDDFLATQSLLDFEQVMDPHNFLSEDILSFDSGDYLDNGFAGQDQGWIWGSGYGF